jgi:hypothetical protein
VGFACTQIVSLNDAEAGFLAGVAVPAKRATADKAASQQTDLERLLRAHELLGNDVEGESSCL